MVWRKSHMLSSIRLWKRKRHRSKRTSQMQKLNNRRNSSRFRRKQSYRPVHHRLSNGIAHFHFVRRAQPVVAFVDHNQRRERISESLLPRILHVVDAARHRSVADYEKDGSCHVAQRVVHWLKANAKKALSGEHQRRSLASCFRRTRSKDQQPDQTWVTRNKSFPRPPAFVKSVQLSTWPWFHAASKCFLRLQNRKSAKLLTALNMCLSQASFVRRTGLYWQKMAWWGFKNFATCLSLPLSLRMPFFLTHSRVYRTRSGVLNLGSVNPLGFY